MEVKVLDTYCGKCGTRYQYEIHTETRFVRGDWLGHHPDHYETYTNNYLEKTPCLSCGHINHSHITIEVLENMQIQGMTKEAKYRYILSEKLRINQDKLKELKDAVTSSEENIKEHKVGINNRLSAVKELTAKRHAISQTISELSCVTNEEHRKKLTTLLNKYSDKAGIEIKQQLRSKDISNKLIKQEESHLEELNDKIFRLEKANTFYQAELS